MHKHQKKGSITEHTMTRRVSGCRERTLSPIEPAGDCEVEAGYLRKVFLTHDFCGNNFRKHASNVVVFVDKIKCN